ncbi:MAG: DUF3408 domain-containing protein [Tannerella sp.]|jgi:hypothetical protein|nr:DUF3408 domain-containing protein [Tannerella sp.]
MATGKDNKKSEDIDELFLLQSIKEQEQPKEQLPTASSAEKPEIPEPSTEKPKEVKEPVKRRRTNVDYSSMFLQRNEFKTRQCVYISQRVHTTISKIVKVISDREITVGGYIDSILAEHLETHKDEIIELYKNAMSKNDENSLY